VSLHTLQDVRPCKCLTSCNAEFHGLTASCAALQEAAGAFSHLQSRVVPQLATPRPEDLSQECTGMLAALCMAQV